MVDVSVIVCTYNRAESLRDTMKSLVDQRFNGGLKYEALVVDNHSTDHTPAVVAQFAKLGNFPVRYRFEARQGLSYARNEGVRAALGQILVFTDDDVTVSPDWIEAIWNCFRETGALVVAGKIERLWHCEQPDWYRDEIGGPLVCQDLGNQRKKWDSSHHTVGANMAFHRSVFQKYGLFREDLGRRGDLLIGGEDREMFLRLSKAGVSIYYEPASVVWHKVEKDRLSKDYMRRWFWDIGRTLGHEMDWKWYHRISVAPIWIWQQTIQSLIRFLVSRLHRGVDAAERFVSEVWVRHQFGILQERFFHWLPSQIGRQNCVFESNVIARQRSK